VSNNIISQILSKITALVFFIVLTSCAHIPQGVGISNGVSGRVEKVCEGIYRGPRLGNLNELKSLRVRTILDLENSTEAVSREEVVAKELGIEVINIPMSEIARPSPADLVKAVKIMENPRLQPVYVHCLHGRDRTGLAVAAYRILHDGWSVDRAYREAVDNGHAWWLYDLILRWKKSLRALSVQKPATTAPSPVHLSAHVPEAS
jgi:DSP-PTPase phosphatase fused to NAD+ Kinase